MHCPHPFSESGSSPPHQSLGFKRKRGDFYFVGGMDVDRSRQVLPFRDCRAGIMKNQTLSLNVGEGICPICGAGHKNSNKCKQWIELGAISCYRKNNAGVGDELNSHRYVGTDDAGRGKWKQRSAPSSLFLIRWFEVVSQLKYHQKWDLNGSHEPQHLWLPVDEIGHNSNNQNCYLE